MYKFLKFQASLIPCPARHMELGCIHEECPVFSWADSKYETKEVAYDDAEIFGYKDSHWKVKIKMGLYSFFQFEMNKLMEERMEAFEYNNAPKGEGWKIIRKKWYHYSNYVEVTYRRERINRRGCCGLSSKEDV